MAARSPTWPKGCSAPATAQDGRRHSRSSSRAHSAKGKASRSGWPVGKASGVSSNPKVGIASRNVARARRDRRRRAALSTAGGASGLRAAARSASRRAGRPRQRGRTPPAPRRSPRRSAGPWPAGRCRARNFELACHEARGGQALAGRQPPLEDGAAHLLADLAVQWRVRRRHRGRGPRGWPCGAGRGITGTARIVETGSFVCTLLPSWSGPQSPRSSLS